MKRVSRLLCVDMVILMVGATSDDVYGQYGSGRALLAYPRKGQTIEEEHADRAACHDWAVAQTGYDPTLVYAAQQWIKPAAAGASYEHPRYPNKPAGFYGAIGNTERRRLNELYYAYLRAGQV